MITYCTRLATNVDKYDILPIAELQRLIHVKKVIHTAYEIVHQVPFVRPFFDLDINLKKLTKTYKSKITAEKALADACEWIQARFPGAEEAISSACREDKIS